MVDVVAFASCEYEILTDFLKVVFRADEDRAFVSSTMEGCIVSSDSSELERDPSTRR